MPNSLRLAYLVFEARKPARWERFMKDMLGLPAPTVHADGSTGWRVDGASQRLVVTTWRPWAWNAPMNTNCASWCNACKPPGTVPSKAMPPFAASARSSTSGM